MQKLAQTTSVSRQHRVQKVHTHITVKGPSNFAVQHATTALTIKARRAHSFMFRHNFNKYLPWHFTVEREKLTKYSKPMPRPCLSPCNMAQSASECLSQTWNIDSHRWLSRVLTFSNVCLSKGFTDLFSVAESFPIDFWHPWTHRSKAEGGIASAISLEILAEKFPLPVTFSENNKFFAFCTVVFR